MALDIRRKATQLSQIAAHDGLSGAAAAVERFGRHHLTPTHLSQRARVAALRWATDADEIIRDVNGSLMALDLRPDSRFRIERGLAVGDIREPDATAALAAVYDRLAARDVEMCVLDAGANVGYYALLAAARLGDSADIHAIEAAPDNAARLRHNVALNDYDVDVCHAAAGAQPGDVELTIHRPNGTIREKRTLQ